MTGGFRSLRSRLVFSYVLLISASIGASLVSGYFISRGALERLTFDRISLAADLQEKVLADWLNESRRDTRLIQSMPHVTAAVGDYLDGRASAGTLRQVLSTVREQIGGIREIYLITSPTGRIAVDTDPTQEVIYMNRSEVYLEGRKAYHLKSVYPWPLDQEPTITLSFPVASPGGATGVLAANLELSALDSLVQLQGRLGQTGRLQLIDQYNVLVSGTQYGRKAYPRGVTSTAIEQALGGHSGRGSYQNADGHPVLGDYRWLPELEMALVVEVSTDEALASVAVLGWTVSLLGVALFGLAFLLVSRLAATLTKPLRQLTEAALAATAGDWSAAVPRGGRDEIAQLGHAFGDMLARLSGLIGALREQQEFGDRLIDSLPGLFYLCDGDLRFRRWNRNGERLLGYSFAELDGRHVGDLVPDESQRAEVETSLRALLATGGEPQVIETTLVSSRGNLVPFLLTAVRIESPAGAAVAGVGIDLTDRRRLEEELFQAQKLESVGRLAGGVAHDFNNILTAIIGNLDLCRLEMPETGPGTSYINSAIQASRRASNLTRQLLAFSRKSIISPKPLRLEAVLTAMRDLLAPVLGENVSLKLSFEPALWPVLVDPAQMDQIILNLVVNARDAMPQGGQVSLSCTNLRLGVDRRPGDSDLPPGDYVCLVVTDTGVGMDAVVLGRLFEPFFTTKDIGKGTGLGLATVFGAVKQNKGSIDVQSQVGEGSRFRILLPRASSPADDLISAPAARRGGGETILLAEDDASIRQLSCNALDRLGYRVLACANGDEALVVGSAEPFDLLVTDLVMPGINGRQLAEALLPHRPGSKVLFVSGYAAETLGTEGVLDDGQDFLAKPYSPAELAARVREILDGQAKGLSRV